MLILSDETISPLEEILDLLGGNSTSPQTRLKTKSLRLDLYTTFCARFICLVPPEETPRLPVGNLD